MHKHSNKIEPYGYVKNMHLIEKAYFDGRLQNATKLLLALFVRYADINGQLERSLAEIGRKSGISRQAVQNQAKKLIQAGYIKRTINPNSYGDNAFNTYTLIRDDHPFTYPATQLGCPPATKLDCIPATSEDCPGATKLGCPKKTLQKEKRKKAHPRDIFLDQIKKEIENHTFQETGNLSEDIIIEQAKACWDTWDGNAQFPEGSYISSFKGWLRRGLRDKKIKNTSTASSGENAAQNTRTREPENPLQDWHERIRPIVGEDIFKSCIRSLHWDGNGIIQAPTKFIASRVKQDYREKINEVLPNTEIIFKPYEGTAIREAISKKL